MTITPTAPAPAAPGAVAGPGTTGTVDPAAQAPGAGDFMAMIQRALADALGTPATPSAGAPGSTAPDPGKGSPADPAAPAATDALAAGLVPSGLPVPLPVIAAAVMTGQGAPAANGATAPATRATASTGAAPAPAVAGTSTAAAAGAVPAAPATPAARAGTDPHDGSGKGDEHADAPSAVAPTPAPASAAAADATTPVPQATADLAGPQPALAPVATPPVPAPTHAGGHGQAAQHVTGQVFPEVTSLLSRGNGAHRITMTLNPEALGEVRVVMTVRDGSVHVRLAAGHDARLALLSGSPELSRLLELAGASDSRIVVRDLPSGPAPATGTPDPGTDLGTGHDANQSQDQHAGTRADNPARDGTDDGTTRDLRGTTGANPPRSIEPVTDTRSAGVDVTM